MAMPAEGYVAPWQQTAAAVAVGAGSPAAAAAPPASNSEIPVKPDRFVAYASEGTRSSCFPC